MGRFVTTVSNGTALKEYDIGEIDNIYGWNIVINIST
jgi:hypothetical protein